jgi:hypothetical protein
MGRGKSRAAAARERMPLCSYGAACARKDCVYRHDKPKAEPAAGGDANAAVCMAYVAGGCSFGTRCRNYHPSEQETAALAERYAKRPCMYGSGCTNPLCLYLHPQQAAEREMEGLALLDDDKPENILPPRTRVPIAVAPAPAPLPLHSRAAAAADADATIPEEIWVPCAARDASAFHIASPLDRFAAVNVCHARADVLDLHFQSAGTFEPVLDELLDARVRECGQVWVLTGSGHHVPGQSHQVKGGLLYQAVGEYLSRRAAEGGWALAPARDKNGYYSAFRVNGR